MDEIYVNNYEMETGKKITTKVQERLEMLVQYNKDIYRTIDYNILDIDELFEEFTKEQIIRITNYPDVQKFIIKNWNNKVMANAIKHLMKNSENWIITLDLLMTNSIGNSELLKNIQGVDEDQINDQDIQQLLTLLMQEENFFEIYTFDDVKNYNNIKNEVCRKIFNGNFNDIPETLKAKYEKEELYKFALLEYQFDISLEMATIISQAYGVDAIGLPEGKIKDFLILINNIINCNDIENIINGAKAEGKLDEPLKGFPNATNTLGQILNMYAELYNDTLYHPTEKDKINQTETYLDEKGNKQDIEVYEIKDDFNMLIRTEGAYVRFKERENYRDLYNSRNIKYHENSECYIGNDNIAPARDGIRVGYSSLKKNQLINAGTKNLGSAMSLGFCMYYPEQDMPLRIPKQMINNTRDVHNEIVQERLIINDNGELDTLKPDFVVWLEMDPISIRKKEGWQEKRNKEEKWINSKKMAAQLGIPIVVIDVERFAEREINKVEVMRKLIIGEEISEDALQSYVEKYKRLSKSELIEESIIKIENNRNGIWDNDNLLQEKLENLINHINKSIEDMELQEKKKCLESLIKVSNKEKENEELKIRDFYTRINEESKQKYKDVKEQIEKKDQDYTRRNLLQLYLDKGVLEEQVNNEKRSVNRQLSNEDLLK